MRYGEAAAGLELHVASEKRQVLPAVGGLRGDCRGLAVAKTTTASPAIRPDPSVHNPKD